MASEDEFPQLLERLRSVETEVATRAAHRLGDLGTRAAVPYLLETLMATDDHLVRNACAVGLRELGDPSAVPYLIALLRDPKTEGYHGTLLYALQTMNPKDEVPFLVDLVATGSWEVRREAMIAIESIEGEIPQPVWQASVDKIRSSLSHAQGDQAELLQELARMFDER